MRITARKALMKALGDSSLRDFKNDEEMAAAKSLYTMMCKNEQQESAPKTRKRRTPVPPPTAGDGPRED